MILAKIDKLEFANNASSTIPHDDYIAMQNIIKNHNENLGTNKLQDSYKMCVTETVEKAGMLLRTELLVVPIFKRYGYYVEFTIRYNTIENTGLVWGNPTTPGQVRFRLGEQP